MELSAEVLIAEADRLFADLPIRHVLITDADVAERLRPGFLDAGYQEVVILTMELRRPPDREPPAAELVELGAAELGPTVKAYMRGGPRDEDAQCELALLKEVGDSGVRFLAALVEGKVVGWCEMRRHATSGVGGVSGGPGRDDVRPAGVHRTLTGPRTAMIHQP